MSEVNDQAEQEALKPLDIGAIDPFVDQATAAYRAITDEIKSLSVTCTNCGAPIFYEKGSKVDELIQDGCRIAHLGCDAWRDLPNPFNQNSPAP
jgi:hypothetical protein